MNSANIRNFCIIAHIDHGKSTLADRMMEITGTVEKRQMKSQLLDSMELEREKGITIKLTPVQMKYKGYELNLIDTPGHVDFSYEVSRSLQAVESAILVVDATQGIQAQTLANVYLAIEQNLTIIPVINKVDLPAADVERVSSEIINLLGCGPSEIIPVSAKTGLNVEKVLDRIIEFAPAPNKSSVDASLSSHEVAPTSTPETRALIFDSYFDDYRGVVLYVRIVDGSIAKNAAIEMLATKTSGIALEVGILKPEMSPKDSLSEGEVGYIVTNLKTTREAKVGDTVTLKKAPAKNPLPGYKNVLPFVYAGFFPVSNEQSIRIEASSGLSEEEINRMKAEAEQNAAADKAEREKIDKLNQADSMIFTTENFLKDNGDKIPADQKSGIESALQQLKDAHKSADVAAIDTAINNLNTVMQAASQQMYSQAGAQGGPQPGADAGQQEQPKQDDTIQDADFEEVK